MNPELENEIVTYILEYNEKYKHNLDCLKENSICFITDERLDIKKVKKEINEFIPSNFKRISLDFIRYFKDDFSEHTWSFISEKFRLKDQLFIKEFKSYLDWERISKYRSDLTKEFINGNEENIPFSSLFNNESLSKEMIRYINERYEDILTFSVKEFIETNKKKAL